MKKKLLALLFIGSAVVASSCKKLEEALDQKIRITPSGIDFTIPAISTTEPNTTIKDFNLNFDLGAEIKKQAASLGIENLKSVKPRSFTITLTNSTAQNNIANFETLEVEVSATGLTPLVAVKVASNPDEQKSTITLPANGEVELVQLMKGSNVKYKVKGKLRRGTTIELNAKLTADYDLVAGL